MARPYFIESEVPLIIKMQTSIIDGKKCEKMCLRIDGIVLKYMKTS